MICFFKKINDTYDHDSGDEALKKIALSIQSSLREGDFLARFGGEEFAIIVSGADKLGMHNLSERIRNSIKTFSFLPKEHKITVSIGYTIVANSEKYEVALKRADTHLYTAKANGRNCIITDEEFIPNIVKNVEGLLCTST